MQKVRIRKIMLFISVFTVVFVIYQLAYGEPNNVNQKDDILLKNSGKSLKDNYEKIGLGQYHEKNIKTLKAINEQPLFPGKSLQSDQYSFSSKTLHSLFDGQKIVHVDLKGAPVKVSYYSDFFPLIKSLGATGVLMEYEDMFPYSGPYSNIPANNTYSRSDIVSILKLAAENSLEVIPLVQTFGHLEFVLKLKEYEKLREVTKYPQVICPSRNGTSWLLKGMIDDIISMHKASRYIHIGCDEVYNLGECHQCLDTMLKNSWTKQQLFLNHVTTVARYIKEKYPYMKPLTWDDEFRKMTLQELIASNVGSLLEPVVWKYTPTVDSYLPEDLWEKYSAVFGSVWIASAFKGATGADSFITDITYHLENHRAWMKLVSTYGKQIRFKGIMITGWQRYDHFAVLCELLPVGLPSLAVNLAFLSQSDIEMQKVPHSVLNTLKCGPGLLNHKMGAHCSFPGSEIYVKAHQLDQLLDQIRQLQETSEARGWLSEYNIRAGFSSPAHVEGATIDLDRYKMELQYLEQDLQRALSEIFDVHTVREWVYTYISPTQRRLQTMWHAKERLLKSTVWPRRPLDALDQLI